MFCTAKRAKAWCLKLILKNSAKRLGKRRAPAPAHSLREYADAETLHIVDNSDAFASQKLHDLTTLRPIAGKLSHVRYANMLSLNPRNKPKRRTLCYAELPQT